MMVMVVVVMVVMVMVREDEDEDEKCPSGLTNQSSSFAVSGRTSAVLRTKVGLRYLLQIKCQTYLYTLVSDTPHRTEDSVLVNGSI